MNLMNEHNIHILTNDCINLFGQDLDKDQLVNVSSGVFEKEEVAKLHSNNTRRGSRRIFTIGPLLNTDFTLLVRWGYSKQNACNQWFPYIR